jgi:capsid protein
MPNFIDKAVGYVFPGWGVKREAWRTIQASLNGGVPTRTSEPWKEREPFRFEPIVRRSEKRSARDRGYEAYDKNPVARTLVDTEVDNVIGDGLNYQPATTSEAWNREAQDRYYQWLDRCSVRGPDMHAGCEIPRLLWMKSRVAGDVGWILVSRGLESRIQIVPAENIVTPDGSYNDKSIVDGIRFDAYGAPTGFNVLTADQRSGQRTFTEIPARDFVFLPHLAGSTNGARGETSYMQVFDILSHLDRYVDGVSLAAWMATVFGIVFKQASPGKQVGLLGTAYNSAGEFQRAITLENGIVKYLGQQDEVAQVQAQQPMQNTPDFIRAMLRLAGMVFGMPLEAFARDMSTCNFASARIGLLPFYRKCKINGQGVFGPRWSRTIRWWLSRERLRPNGDPKKWITPFPPDYWRHELLSNAWDYTDPVSEVQGDMLQVDAGFKSPQMVIAERGRDAERIIREREEWRDKTKELKTVHSTMTRDATNTVTAVDANGNPIAGAQPLNGAQITAAIDVLTKRREGALSDDAATELLVQIGMPSDRAGAVVASLSKLTVGTGDVAFKREILKQLLAVPAAREAVYNGTDIEDLIVQTGLSPERGYEAPWIPVKAAPGEMVSGAIIYDPEGNIVGGDIENNLPPEPTHGDNNVPNSEDLVRDQG